MSKKNDKMRTCYWCKQRFNGCTDKFKVDVCERFAFCATIKSFNAKKRK